ncbi:MAG: HAD family phosphatase [Acidobacteriota bacterium]|jgi:beta-phosphoglucomutase|nr:HAD family phosphatase [Acidobacteriota bacterium]
MIQGVLFDLDGVIVDTLHYHYLAWKHMFEELGGAVTKHSVLLHEGRNSREVLPILMQEAGVFIPPEQQEAFIEKKRAYYRSIVQVSHYPGAFRVIDALKARGLKTALVTACALKNMQHSLDAEQQTHFDFIITGDEVPRAKPFPDPYLVAARQLQLDPSQCAVVENAPLGIDAARNAGMYCIAIETTLGKEYLAAADCILQDIGELLTLPILQP